MGIENESVVIIGGSSGMGLAIAKEAADAGAVVTIAGRSQSKLDEASRAIAGDVTTYIVDLSDEGSVMKLFQSIGSFDHLVISGSSVKTGQLRELSIADARASMDSKFWGAYMAATLRFVRKVQSHSFPEF